ncbi:DsbA family protein [Enhydrobacter sp.]|jgi:2-hydroxychromene-2-carboxylate isomerase|uniref:2-hydroxychromene-2-carboxylate isomerase n=1 Tax=Enhydrobacter sp. TaxID=1894999 RepID=UPI002609F29C|nr:DsbA family protein [Enhydrobacter sp.]WIM09773.1 MAG: 2-hydroxychromene-2-carboxylate isomerase family protein [Enhydrobacter sp.]
MDTVDFFLGVGSRYSYLAASQVERIEAQTGYRFVWKPIASGRLIDRRRGGNPFRDVQGSGPYNGPYREYDAKAWAAYYGIPFHEPAAFAVDPVLPALACLAAGEQGALVPCCRLLQQLVFVDGVTIDLAAITALPARLGLAEGRFRQDLEAPATRGRHEALLDEAERRGAFGVPTFFVGQRMFWGNDRLPLLEATLRGTELPRWPDR